MGGGRSVSSPRGDLASPACLYELAIAAIFHFLKVKGHVQSAKNAVTSLAEFRENPGKSGTVGKSASNCIL